MSAIELENTAAAFADARNPQTSIFEVQTCSRCGGSGRYSYNAFTQDRCFKCGGRGWTYTKRGAAAAAKLTELLSKRVRDLQPGDRIRYAGIPGFSGGGWATIEKVGRDTGEMEFGSRVVDFDYEANERWGYQCNGYSAAGVDPDSLVRVAHTADEKAAARAAALDQHGRAPDRLAETPGRSRDREADSGAAEEGVPGPEVHGQE